MSVIKQTRPQSTGDFYHISALLSEEDQALLQRVQAFMEAEVVPIIHHYWTREEFPQQILPGWLNWALLVCRITDMGSQHFFPAKSPLRRRQDREKMMQMNFKRGIGSQTSKTDSQGRSIPEKTAVRRL